MAKKLLEGKPPFSHGFSHGFSYGFPRGYAQVESSPAAAAWLRAARRTAEGGDSLNVEHLQ